MSVVCLHCRPRTAAHKPVTLGDSRVVETRKTSARTRAKDGSRDRTITIVRIRECLTCRWRWKTREVNTR